MASFGPSGIVAARGAALRLLWAASLETMNPMAELTQAGSPSTARPDPVIAPPALRLSGTPSLSAISPDDAILQLLKASCALEAQLRQDAEAARERATRAEPMLAVTGVGALDRAAAEAAELVRQVDALLAERVQAASGAQR